MIGGNQTAILQVKNQGVKNVIGERTGDWDNPKKLDLTGWLDLASGDSKHTVYSAKIQESTHIFMCDYRDLKAELDCPAVTSENTRIVINDAVYDVTLIDDPMNLHQHLEIYLKYTGGQNVN